MPSYDRSVNSVNLYGEYLRRYQEIVANRERGIRLVRDDARNIIWRSLDGSSPDRFVSRERHCEAADTVEAA